MKSVIIRLDTINDVKSFVNTVSKYDFDVDLISGRYAEVDHGHFLARSVQTDQDGDLRGQLPRVPWRGKAVHH